MIFKQLFDLDTSTYTYLLADEKTKEAVLIDSVFEKVERDSKLIKDLGLNLKYLMDTHVHADHITGMSKLKALFPSAKMVIYKDSGNICANIFSKEGDEFKFGDNSLKVLHTPGHTNGCVSFYTEGLIFTGDSLLIRGTGRTDFQQGSSENLYDSITEKIFTLPDNTLVYPGHDYNGLTSSSIAEEKALNPRMANKTKAEFVELMANLKLPYPRKIKESVPANINCGDIGANPSFARMSVQEVYEHYQKNDPDLVFIDVREPFEWDEGTIPNVLKISLGSIQNHTYSLNKQLEYIMICRSGGRSGKASEIMKHDGFRSVYNMEGGMNAWRMNSFPVTR